MSKLKLHTYWRSSSAYRVRLALAYKGLAYEPVFVNLLEHAQKKPEFVATSPMGQIPCLVVDGAPFVESVAIIELLEEQHPTPALLPSEPASRAHVRALAELINSGTQPMQNLSVLGRVSQDEAQKTAWARHFMQRGLTAFEALIAQHEQARGQESVFAYGASFTMADVFLLPQLYSSRRVGVDLSPFSRILRAEKACSALSVLASAHPEAQGDAVLK